MITQRVLLVIVALIVIAAVLPNSVYAEAYKNDFKPASLLFKSDYARQETFRKLEEEVIKGRYHLMHTNTHAAAYMESKARKHAFSNMGQHIENYYKKYGLALDGIVLIGDQTISMKGTVCNYVSATAGDSGFYVALECPDEKTVRFTNRPILN